MSDKIIFVPYRHNFSFNQSKIKSAPDFGLSFEVNGPFFYIKNSIKKIRDCINKNIKQETMSLGISPDLFDYKIISSNEISKTKKYSVLLSSKQNNLEYVAEFCSIGSNKLKTLGVYQVY